MKIRSLNNATVLAQSDQCSLLIDPWLVGDLYGGAWSPFATCKNLEFLKTVTHVFVSHIHEDHWDRETLKLLNKEVEFFIPNLPINYVLKKYIEQLGFSNIHLSEPFNKISLPDMDLTIIPPLNAFGQELGAYEKNYETDATHIDTALLVEDHLTNTSHLFLCDNTPYDLSVLEKVDFANLSSLWYPFNSYAQDYPLCYEMENFEKIKVHQKMHNKRMNAIEKCVKKIKPKYYFPHSADFVLNGPNSKSFEEYTENKYMVRKLVAETYAFSDLSDCVSAYADFGDELEIISGGDIKINRDKYGYELTSSKPELDNFKSHLTEENPQVIDRAFSEMLRRCQSFNIDLTPCQDWLLELEIDGDTLVVSYKEMRFLKDSDEISSDSKILNVKLTKTQFDALMMRELHWNNAQIGMHLRFKRNPNEFCQELYKSLNFLHL